MFAPAEIEHKIEAAYTPLMEQRIRSTIDIPDIALIYPKACHTEYKYDSVPEHTFSVVLEKDPAVLKWLRPTPKQFKIWYAGGKLYEPDFIVESADAIYMVEVKNRHDIRDEDVKHKAQAAKKYCEHVNVFAPKPWRYVQQVDTYIKRSSTLAGSFPFARFLALALPAPLMLLCRCLIKKYGLFPVIKSL